MQFKKATSQEIPEGINALEEGAKVISSDKQHIGHIEDVVADTPQETVSHIFVSQGLIWVSKKLIPVDWISDVAEEAVYLSVSSRFVENLPEYQT